MVRELQDQEGSFPSLVSKSRPHRGGVSLLSYLSDPSHASLTPRPQSPLPHSLTRAHSFPSGHRGGTHLGGSQTQLSFGEEEERKRRRRKVEEWGGALEAPSSGETSQTASDVALQRCSTPDILRKNPAGEPEPEPDQDQEQDSPDGPSLSAAASSSSSPPPAEALSPGRSEASGAQRRTLALRLGVLVTELKKKLQSESCCEKELKALEQQLVHLETILKNHLSLLHTSSSEETLAVEEVLGSFDFLSHDLNTDEDGSCVDSGISSFQQSVRLLSADSQSASEEELVAPLTSGNWSLDQALETHLDTCCILLQMMRSTEFGPSQRELLEETSHQAGVLEQVGRLLLEKKGDVTAADVLPKAQRSRDVLLFWEECVNDSSSPFCSDVDSFSRALRKRYSHKVKAKQPGQSERVFSALLQQLQAACRLVPGCRPVCSPHRVTLFQLSVYLQRWSFQDLGEHISRLSREEYILSALTGPKRRRALNKLRGRGVSELLPLGSTLQTLAALLLDSNHKVCKAASSCLCRAAACSAFRNKALVFYTESLKSSQVQVQQASCLALKSLRATESVEHISDLWRSEDENLRRSARETVVSFGKKGLEAFQRMEQLSAQMEEEAYKNQETQITIL